MRDLRRAWQLLLEIQLSPEYDNMPIEVTDRLDEAIEILDPDRKTQGEG